MNNKYNQVIVILSSLFFIYGCEYERIAAPENECVPESVELVLESVRNTDCGAATGEIVVLVNGASNDQYEYRINDGDFGADNTFEALEVGNYTIEAKAVDANCVSDPIEVLIENEDGIQLTLTETTNSNCGDSSGKIVVSQEGGVEPIEYIINNAGSQDVPEFTGLSIGEYTILARDANGCEAELSDIEISSGISFSNDIKAIISTNCAVNGCHNGTRPPDFSVDENIFQNASRIKSRTGSGTMPPAGRPDLTEQEIQAIACWVDGGALDN